MDRMDRVSKVCDAIKILGSIEYQDSNMLRDLACLLDSIHAMRKRYKPEEFTEYLGLLVDPQDEGDEESVEEALEESVKDFDKMFARVRVFMDIFWQQSDGNL